MQSSKTTIPKEPYVMDGQGKGLKTLKKKVLMGRYEVGDFLIQGSQGRIYDCKDLETGAHLVIKVSDDCGALAAELRSHTSKNLKN